MQTQSIPVVDTFNEFGATLTSVTLVPLALVFIVGVVVGAVVSVMALNRARAASVRNSQARYPRDWAKRSEIFTRDWGKHQGYYDITGKQVVSSDKYSGSVRIGRLYPRFEIFKLVPEMWPLTRVREWVLRKTTREVWIPYGARFTHWGIAGPTGKGKSTAFAHPQLAYGALEENTAYFAIDVKSPQFTRMYSRSYKNAGKEVYFFDPWSIDESLGFEPLWRAPAEVLNEISEVVATYSTKGESAEGGNSEFFNLAAQRVMRGLVELAQFWPRRYCNLPAVRQLVVAGFDKVEAAFRQAPAMLPTFADLEAAIDVVLGADEEMLRQVPRDPAADVTRALEVLDRAGYRIAHLTKNMRRYRAQRDAGSITAEKFSQAEKAFWTEVRTECDRRKLQLQKLIEGQGEYLDMPPETKGSVMSTLTNKISWFQDENVAKAFSRDELDVRRIVERPCLLLVGAPMAKLNVGSLFVASILTNLAINAIFQRGAAIEAGAKNVWKGGTIALLDEFPQLNIRKASQALATFRGFKGALFLIYQDRGQLKKLYGEDFTNIEANCVHQVLLQGAHIETCKFYAEAIGQVSIEKRSESGTDGDGKKNISKSIERVSRVDTNDIRDGRLNGQTKEKLAFSVGGETPAFPFIPVPYWEDPLIRKLLDLELTVVKEGPFWNWTDYWQPRIDPDDKYIHRRKRNRRDPENDPVSHRLDDAFGQYVEYLIGRPKERVVRDGREVVEVVYDELEVPNLDLAAILGQKGGAQPAPGQARNPAAPAPPPPAGGPGGPAAKANEQGQVPVYGADFRKLVNEDFKDAQPLSMDPPAGGDLRERIEDHHENEEA